MPTTAVSIEDQIAEVKRELAMRERVYPRWINAPKPKLTPQTGERQMARLRAVLATLEQVAAAQPAAPGPLQS